MREKYISINDHILPVLLAETSEEQERGLMFVEPPVPNMAFPYKQARVNKFWMRNTISPLDIIFCHNGRVSQLCAGEPYSTAVIGADKPSDLVVEFPRGTIDKLKIKIGQLVELI
jgi:uncharacterized membrane protein (UPF0127 family)